MATYEEALKIVLEHINTLETEEKPIIDCIGQVSAENIYSNYNLPLMDTSGPDGYAVRSADLIDASKSTPVKLEIIETLRAGFLPKKSVTHGTASRIMTGSILPPGADCVVRFEDTDEPENKNGPNNNNPEKVDEYPKLERKILMNAFMKLTPEELFGFQAVKVTWDSPLLSSRNEPRKYCSKMWRGNYGRNGHCAGRQSLM